MDKRFVFFSTFLLLGVFSFLYISWQSPNRDRPLIKTSEAPPVKEERQAEEASPRKNRPAAREAITASEVSAFRNSFPDYLNVKEEAGQNPHQTPDSLIRFAETLGPLVEKALSSRRDAGVLVDELHDCALSDHVSLSARTLCLSKAEKISRAHPDLKARVREIREGASADVRELQAKMKLLRKKGPSPGALR